MKIFYIIILFLYISCTIVRLSENKINYELGNTKPSLVFTLFIIIILSIVSGLRWGIGDTSAYINLYEIISEGNYNMSDSAYEVGFIYFFKVLMLISSDPQFMIFITSIIFNTFMILTLRQYSSYFEMEIFLFLTTGIYISSMNGIRQWMVISILFYSTRYIIDGKQYRYFIIVALMSLIHTSAIIMIPVYYVVKKEAWSKSTIILILTSLVILLGFSEIVPALFSVLGDSGLGEYSGHLNINQGGASIIRVLILFVPVFLSYIYKNDLKKNVNGADVFINMSLLAFITMCMAMYNWIFARIGMYFEVYNLILIPYILRYGMKDIKFKNLVYYCCIVLYFLLFYVDLDVIQNIQYYSKYLNI